jgi:ER lumen protein retaining receptor
MEKVKNIMTDPQSLYFEVRRKRKDIIFWTIVVSLIGFVYFLLSDKDFSFLLVLSSTVQMFSFLVIIYKVYSCQSCSGLSNNSFICYLIVLLSRLSSTLFYNGYLPADSAGDWFYQLTEIVSLFTCITLIYMVSKTHRDTADTEKDTFNYKYVAIPALALALLVHTSLNRNFLTDVFWSNSMYLETVALIPQLIVFRSKGGVIESYTSHYVALQGLSRLFSLLFWYDTYSELNDDSLTAGYSMFSGYVGYFVMASQITQLIIMIDYYIIYFKSLWKGEKMNLDML